MQDEFDINVRAEIKSAMKKERNHQGCWYGFGRLLTRFLRIHDIEEDSLDYMTQLERRPIDLTITRAMDVSHGPILTLAENHD